MGPLGHVGVELHLMRSDASRYDASNREIESAVPTPPGVVHAVGGRRLRLLRSSCGQAGEPWRQATVEALDDDLVTEQRRERLCYEATRAATLIAAGTERR
eukprot:CAMPEP_0119061978 /NCGR_PEP_ID=MMETSP1178-20130426/5673_1 /TAXON_ID=33656 /ORGANISM="unid sp, Strain CCMP2000" /LENGTH=100 /DNA_ID=CAMNT_0007043217 /DNA_START=1 /DNA_END=299 /DNA_ORIENTATION=-